jgi:hypothetical protein
MRSITGSTGGSLTVTGVVAIGSILSVIETSVPLTLSSASNILRGAINVVAGNPALSLAGDVVGNFAVNIGSGTVAVAFTGDLAAPAVFTIAGPNAAILTGELTVPQGAAVALRTPGTQSSATYSGGGRLLIGDSVNVTALNANDLNIDLGTGMRFSQLFISRRPVQIRRRSR